MSNSFSYDIPGTLDFNPAVLGFDQNGWDIESRPPQDRVDSKDPVGLKKTPAPVAREPRLMVFPNGK